MGVGGALSDRADVWACEGCVWEFCGVSLWVFGLWGGVGAVGVVGFGGVVGCERWGVMVCVWYGFWGWCGAERGNFRTPSPPWGEYSKNGFSCVVWGVLTRVWARRLVSYVELRRALEAAWAREQEARRLAEQERAQAEEARRRAERLAQKLRELGIEPDEE